MRKYFLLILLSIVAISCVQNPHPKNVKESTKETVESFEFNQPDIVGTLGDAKVRMNYYVIQDLMYTDTPTPFSRDWKGYKAPERTYDSVIHSFGFYLNYEQSKLRDIRNDGGLAFYDEMKISGTPWILVGIHNNIVPLAKDDDVFDSLINDRYFNTWSQHYPIVHLRQPENQYGLEHYVLPLKNPKTGVAYDFGYSIHQEDDLFILRDKNGRVQTYMSCFLGTDVPNPPCSHNFFIREKGLDVEISLSYSRHRLYDWRRIEQEVRKVMFDFVANAKNQNL